MKEQLKLKSVLKGGILLLCFAMMVGCSSSSDGDKTEAAASTVTGITWNDPITAADLKKIKAGGSQENVNVAFTYDSLLPAYYVNLIKVNTSTVENATDTLIGSSNATGTGIPKKDESNLATKANSKDDALNFQRQAWIERLPATTTALVSGEKFYLLISESNDSKKGLIKVQDSNNTKETFKSEIVTAQWDVSKGPGTSISDTLPLGGTTYNAAAGTLSTVAIQTTTMPNATTPIEDITLNINGDIPANKYAVYAVWHAAVKIQSGTSTPANNKLAQIIAVEIKDVPAALQTASTVKITGLGNVAKPADNLSNGATVAKHAFVAAAANAGIEPSFQIVVAEKGKIVSALNDDASGSSTQYAQSKLYLDAAIATSEYTAAGS